MSIKLLKVLFVILLIIFTNVFVNAQQFKIGKNVFNIKTGAVFELEDTAKALLLTRIADPSLKIGANAYRGMLVFDSSINLLSYYDGSKWRYPIIDSSASQNIYNSDAELLNNRTVNKIGKYLRFIGNTGDTVSFNSNGNVGIGTNDNTYRLHIKGGTSLSATDINARTIAINGMPMLYNGGNNMGNNLAFGNGLRNSTGRVNTAVGYQALGTNTTGSINTAVGHNALFYNTTGSGNTVVGEQALAFNTTGSFNVALGQGTLIGNTTGSFNSALGNSTLNYNVIGSHNVATGDSAMFYNRTGSSNTAIGSTSLYNNVAGYYNVALGDSALFTTLGNSNIGIGYFVDQLKGKTDSTLNIGNVITGIKMYSNSAKIGINLGNTGILPISALQVSGAVRTDSLVLVSLLHKNSMTTRDSLLMIDSVGVVKKIDIGNIPSNNIYTTNGSLTGHRTVQQGNNDLTFSQNIGSIKINNANIGYPTAITISSTASQPLGFTGIDVSSSSPYETILGKVSTTIFGTPYTYQLAVSGSSNPIGVGPNPCQGCFSIFNKRAGTESFVITPNTNNIGIGTNTPTQKLDVNGNIQSTGLQVNGEAQGFFIININKSNSWGGITFSDNTLPKWGIQKTASNDMLFTKLDGTGTPLTIAWNGNIGVGTLTPTHAFQVNGSAGTGAYCDGAGWMTGSDMRLKKEITPSTYGIAEVMKLRPQFYVYKADISGKREVGLIAQEVQKIIPEIVSGKEGDVSKGETLGISYGNLSTVLVSAIQEQQQIIEENKKQIIDQQNQINELKQLVQQLLKK